jgi:hypothetical protein
MGTVTIVFVDEDIIYFESCQGDSDFIREIRGTTIGFGQEHLLQRIRVIRDDTLK